VERRGTRWQEEITLDRANDKTIKKLTTNNQDDHLKELNIHREEKRKKVLNILIGIGLIILFVIN
jgi:hypothetical protein